MSYVFVCLCLYELVVAWFFMLYEVLSCTSMCYLICEGFGLTVDALYFLSFFAYAWHRFSILFELTWNQCLNQHFVKSKRSIFRTSKTSEAQMHTVTYKGVTNNFEYYIVDRKTPFIYFLCIFWFEKIRANTTEQTCKHCAKDCKSSNLSRRTTLFHAQYVWLKQDIIKTISEITWKLPGV